MSGERIVVECPLDETEMHKTDLDVDVANTNAVYIKQMRQTERQEKKTAVKAKSDRTILRGLRRKLFGKKGQGDE